jgi:hypothetical protein
MVTNLFIVCCRIQSFAAVILNILHAESLHLYIAQYGTVGMHAARREVFVCLQYSHTIFCSSI